MTDNIIPFDKIEGSEPRKQLNLTERDNVVELPQKPTGGEAVYSVEQPTEDGGPPEGMISWSCSCGSFAYYLTPEATHCWECHACP
jgi:hypothetical protein